MVMGRHINRLKKMEKKYYEDTKNEHSDKVVKRMIFHALDDPEDGKTLVVALFYGKFAGPLRLVASSFFGCLY